MLVWLAEYLQQYISVFNVISYISVRATMALLTAFNYWFCCQNDSRKRGY